MESPLLPKPIIEQTQEEKEELLSILKSHPQVDTKSFLDIQNAWDNVMAYAIVRVLKDNPGTKMVVLVGRGHASDLNSGIPRRVRELNPNLRQVILQR